MISIIKTAIITIIISFISGLLLEYYKNLAPKILCNIGEGIPLVIKNRNVYAYILTVRNLSNKTIHNITLNIHDSHKDLNFGDAEITKGLKFDSSIKDNILDVYIPFLSKDDEFKVTLYVDYDDGEYNKPTVIIRSPENFKEVDSVEATGVLALLMNMPKNITNLFSNDKKENKRIRINKKENFTTIINTSSDDTKIVDKSDREILNRNKNKKIFIGIISITLIISIGILGRFYFQKVSAHTPNSDIKADAKEQSTDVTKSSEVEDKNKDKKASTHDTTKNSNSKTSTNEENKNTEIAPDVTNKNLDEKPQTDKENQNTKPEVSKPTENADTKVPTNKTNGSVDEKSSNETTKNVDTKPQTENQAKNVPSKSSTDETKNTNTSATGTTGNITN
ncbi:membrane protein [Clostridium sp. CTA-5]